MIDDRRPSGNRSHQDSTHTLRYYQKTFALNRLYATRHGLGFLLVRPTAADWLLPSVDQSGMADRAITTQLCPAWCRVKILAAIVSRLLRGREPRGPPPGPQAWGRLGGSGRHREHASSTRHWILYIDSDAYVREQHTDFLARLSTPANQEVHFAIAREEPPAGGFRSPKKRAHGVRTPSMNAGVLFVRASHWTSSLLAAWIAAADTPVCAPFRQSWPCEQQCFHELLRNRTMLPPGWRRRIATAPMQLFNSPWGTFVRHVWGGPGAALRRHAFDDELKVQGVWDPGHLSDLLQGAYDSWVDMPC
jgi:hypothetical protein